MSKESLEKNLEEKKEVSEVIIEKETKKAEEKAEVENVIVNHNFIISQNRVLFVDKITNKDIKNGGKFSKWENYMTGESVQILDKDYGKSAELMRALLETENATPLWKKALILLILWGIIFAVWVVLFSVIPSWEKEVKKENTIIENNGATQVGDESSLIKWTLTAPKIEIEEPEIEETKNWPMQSFRASESIEVIQAENEIETLKQNYEMEKLKIELQKLMKEKNEEVHKNFELQTEIEEKNEIIVNLEQKVKILESKPKNLSQEAFLLHLGNVVYERCEKAEARGEKNGCKDIYYNFITNE